MIIAPGELREGQEIEADICIIGAGTAGLTIAREFFNTGKSVVVLESGDEKPEPDTQDLTSGENIGIPYYDLKTTRARAFGGSSHLWYYVPGLRLRGMDAIDFEKREWIPYSGWPISKNDLDPYYEKAHELFKIGPYRYKPEDWFKPDEHNYLESEDSDPYETTMFQFARKDIFYNDYYEDFKKAEKVKVFLNATVLNIETSENAKQVTHLTVSAGEAFQYRVKARHYILAAGGLENPRLLLLSDNQAKNGLGNNKDLVGRFFMEHPHMWGKNVVGTYYPSESEKFNPNQIFHFHYRKGYPMLGYLILKEEAVRKNELLNITFGIRGASLQYPAGYQEGVAALRNFLSNVKRGRINKGLFGELGAFLKNGTSVVYEGVRKLVNGRVEDWNRYGIEETGINLNFMAEQAPNPESRVLLGSERDRFNQRKMKLDWRLTELDVLSVKKSLHLLSENLERKGLGHIEVTLNTNEEEFFKKVEGGYHHMGTTRMHEDPSLGVVDANCKLHGTENLFVAGSSVFPTVGYANPTLTIAALAIRLADHLKQTPGYPTKNVEY